MNETVSLEVKSISKSFYGSRALDDVSISFHSGEVHILCGENGAGKSTLMKIISGLYTKDSGEILLEGQPLTVSGPADAENQGIVTIYQESNLSPTISVAENIFLHREPGRFLIDRKKMHAEARKYLDMVGCNVQTTDMTDSLSAANQQLVQIAKALSRNARILILDEPCSSISQEDTIRLFSILKELKNTGITIIYIDHRIDNFKMIGDRISVLRDGQLIGTRLLREIDKDDIIRMMVGREMSSIFHKTNTPQEDVIFSIEHYSTEKLRDISFSVRRGEVFGLAGLVGAGRSEIVRAIFGIDPVLPGAKTVINDREITIRKPLDAIRNHLAYIPEDRKMAGFIPGRGIQFNLTLPSIRRMGKTFLVNKKTETAYADKQISALKIKALSNDANVRDLSGGNQQKVVMGKWLMIEDVEVLLLDEPTRGIDIGVKMEIYGLIDKLTSEGKSIILITSELVELISMCDRIAVIREGSLQRIFEREEFSQEAIMHECV